MRHPPFWLNSSLLTESFIAYERVVLTWLFGLCFRITAGAKSPTILEFSECRRKVIAKSHSDLGIESQEGIRSNYIIGHA